MGYRSEVVLVLTKEGYKRFKQELDKSPFKEDALELLSYADVKLVDDDTQEHLYYWDWVKWYYSAAQAINETLSHVPLNQFYFMRIGEDLEDPIEQLGACIMEQNIFEIYPVRKINFTGA